MKSLAAVLIEPGRDLDLMDLDLPALGEGQVLVEVLYSGACHTQVLEVRGRRGADPWCPHCLGHEAVGRVLETGAGVTRVRAGDAVVLGWIQTEGKNGGGVTYGYNGRKVNAGPVATFMKTCIASENRLTRLPPPPHTAAIRLLQLIVSPRNSISPDRWARRIVSTSRLPR